MGNKTRKNSQLCKIIVDIPYKDHYAFKTKVKANGITIKEAIHNLIKQFNESKVSLDKTL